MADAASGPRAGFWPRFGAYLIDVILLWIVAGIIWAILGRVTANLLYLLLFVAYFGYFEGGESGQSLGKRALGIRVYDFSRGGSIGFGRGAIRAIGKIISGIPCALGFLWSIWDNEKQTWHDKMATTVVVPTSQYPVERETG